MNDNNRSVIDLSTLERDDDDMTNDATKWVMALLGGDLATMKELGGAVHPVVEDFQAQFGVGAKTALEGAYFMARQTLTGFVNAGAPDEVIDFMVSRKNQAAACLVTLKGEQASTEEDDDG